MPSGLPSKQSRSLPSRPAGTDILRMLSQRREIQSQLAPILPGHSVPNRRDSTAVMRHENTKFHPVFRRCIAENPSGVSNE